MCMGAVHMHVHGCGKAKCGVRKRESVYCVSLCEYEGMVVGAGG
jgi:hypothetical protein